MTGKELIEEIKVLGRRSTLNYPFGPQAIYTAINRAIDEVNRLFPVTEKIRLLNYPPRPVQYHKGITVHRGGEDIVYNASEVKSLAFAVSGTGRATLTATEAEQSYTFEWLDQSNFKLMRGIIKDLIGSESGEVTLTFQGDYSYMIKDLSFYGELVSPIYEDIDVYSPWVSYDLASVKYAGARFLDFDSLPVRSDDVSLNSPRDYKIEGSVIYLPAEKQGVYEVTYRRRPLEITADNEGDEIDIDRELHNLLAPRAAYYLFYVIDDEVADRCEAEYQKLVAIYNAKIRKVRTPAQFRDVRGW
jgi:hypothetical protein